ncbi:MAG: hypothetical protein RJA44_1080 [Pseudomonadota bacterium]|jgi:holin-like protein
MIALRGLALLLLLQAIGESLAHALHWPLPGPVLGLILLLVLLQLAPSLRPSIAAIAELLLAHLSLLFVPVGVGVITHLTLLAEQGLQLVVAITLSTWVGMIVTALVLRLLLRRREDSAPTTPPQNEERHDG